MIVDIDDLNGAGEPLAGNVAEGAGAVVAVACVVVVDTAVVEVAVVEVAAVELAVDVVVVDDAVDNVVDSVTVVLVASTDDVVLDDNVVLDDRASGASLSVNSALSGESESASTAAVFAAAEVSARTSSSEPLAQPVRARTHAAKPTQRRRLLANSGRSGVDTRGRVRDVRRKEFDDLLVEFVDNTAERKNVEYTLSILEQVDHFFTATNQSWLAAVDHQVGRGDIFAELVLEVRKYLADLLKTDTCVEQVLDDL